jgi:hypothetical protein
MSGNPKILLLGWDSDENGCGFSPDTVDYPYLYFPKYPDFDLLDQI